MNRYLKLFLKFLVIKLFILSLVLAWLAYEPKPEEYRYGMSFNTMYARELGLDWQETYDAILNDLGVRQRRHSTR